MQTNTLTVPPSTSFLNLLICLQGSDNNFERGDVSRDVSYEPEKAREIFMFVFSENSC